MFETQKIDSFFSGEKNLLDEEEKVFISRRTKVVRFFKLFLPCLTALLLGMGIVLFDFEANNETPLAMADEEKIYFEKFRMKNTVFEITDKDNQLSTLTAEIVEEVTPGKKLYTLLHPAAKTVDKAKTLSLIAQNGAYDQNTQILELKTDVAANYNSEMDIKTNSATYNFATEQGFGNEKITGSGNKGNFQANRFTFDKKANIATLIGDVLMNSNDTVLTTPEKATMYLNENKFSAPVATVTKGKDKLKADLVTVFFKNSKNFELDKAFTHGHTEIYSDGKKAFADRGEYYADSGIVKLFDNVKIVDTNGYTATADKGIYDAKTKIFTLNNNVNIKDKSGYTATSQQGVYDMNKKTLALTTDVKIVKGDNIITAPKAVYFQNKEEFRFYDNVKIVQGKNSAVAKNGIYYIKKNLAELTGNVVITKDGNTVRGDKAVSDFNTSKSKLIAKKGGRISGKLLENTLKSKKDK